MLVKGLDPYYSAAYMTHSSVASLLIRGWVIFLRFWIFSEFENWSSASLAMPIFDGNSITGAS